MKKILLLGCLSLCSCATILNSKQASIIVYTDSPATVQVNGNIKKSEFNETEIFVPRMADSVTFEVTTQEKTETVTLNYRTSFAHYLNFMNLGLGIIVDNLNGNYDKFSYPKQVYIYDDEPGFRTNNFERLTEKGNLYLDLSIPYINQFEFNADNPLTHRNSNIGNMGGEIGLAYYYKKNRLFGIRTGAASNYTTVFPFIPTVALGGDLHSSVYAAAYLGQMRENFQLEYGLGYSYNRVLYDFHDEPIRDFNETHEDIEGYLSAKYIPRKSFYINLTYRPRFLRVAPTTEFRYGHTISLGLGWQIRLLKSRKE